MTNKTKIDAAAALIAALSPRACAARAISHAVTASMTKVPHDAAPQWRRIPSTRTPFLSAEPRRLGSRS